MRKGNFVIADHPERKSRVLTRSYGIVLEIINRGGVIIELADGAVIKRQRNSVAVYVHPLRTGRNCLKGRKFYSTTHKNG